jgi:thiol-disulfide isomerase/thioredoxin
MKNAARTITQFVVTVCFVFPMLTGCGLMDKFNLPFQNKLSVAKVPPPIAKFNPKPVDLNTYEHVKAVDEHGNPIELSPSTKSILFVAYWCPHCQRTLVAFSNHVPLQQMPVVVSLGFAPGTSLAFAKKVTHEEIVALHLPANLQVDYALSLKAGNYIKDGYPTFVFADKGQLQELVGEHTWPVWSQAIAGK